MSDIDLARKALRFWFDSTNLSSKGYSFYDAIQYYQDTSRKTNRVSPSFLKNFGGAVRDSNLSDSRLRDAMQSLGATDKNAWPWYGSFFDALAGERLSFRYEDAIDVAKATVSDIANTAKAGLGIYVGVLAVGTLIFILPLLRRK